MAGEELIEELVAGLAAAGFEDVRLGHGMVLRDILTGGLRPSELAARMGLSKQATNDLLREFEAAGYITLVPDPDDGRARRITERGASLEETASRLSAEVARRSAEHVGQDRFEQRSARDRRRAGRATAMKDETCRALRLKFVLRTGSRSDEPVCKTAHRSSRARSVEGSQCSRNRDVDGAELSSEVISRSRVGRTIRARVA